MRKFILIAALFLILCAHADAADQLIVFDALHFKVLKPGQMQMVVGILTGDQETTWTTNATEYSYLYSVGHMDCGFGAIYAINKPFAFEELSSVKVKAMFSPTMRLKTSGFRTNTKGVKYYLIEASDTVTGALADQAIFDHKAINKFLVVNTVFPGTDVTPRTRCSTAAMARSVNLKYWKNFIGSITLDQHVGGQ